MSGKRNRQRGNELERELVNKAKEFGFEAERAWGSNGRSLGETEGVDCLVDGVRIQAKRKKTIPQWLRPPEGADVVAFREDHKKPYIIISYEEWLRLRKLAGSAEFTSTDTPSREPELDWTVETPGS